MSAPDPLMALSRSAHLAAMLSLLGALIFAVMVVPGEMPALWPRLRRLACWNAALAFGFGATWFLVTAASVADARSLADVLAAVPAMIDYMRFGKLLLAQLVLLLSALVLLTTLKDRHRPVLALTAVALGLQPLLGHAGALSGNTGNVLVGAEVLHLLAAAAWLGGLLPLLLCLAVLPAKRAVQALRRFSPLGLAAVLAIAATGLLQGWILAGGPIGLLDTGYGQIALFKAALFAAALVCAALNSFVLTDRLARTESGGSRNELRVSVATELVLGLIVVLASGWLANMMPEANQHPLPEDWRPALIGVVPLLVAIAMAAFLRRSHLTIHRERSRT